MSLICEHYQKLISAELKEDLEGELSTAKHFLKYSNNQRNIHNTYDTLAECSASFKCLLKLFKIIFTLPVSTASNERFFQF